MFYNGCKVFGHCDNDCRKKKQQLVHRKEPSECNIPVQNMVAATKQIDSEGFQPVSRVVRRPTCPTMVTTTRDSFLEFDGNPDVMNEEQEEQRVQQDVGGKNSSNPNGSYLLLECPGAKQPKEAEGWEGFSCSKIRRVGGPTGNKGKGCWTRKPLSSYVLILVFYYSFGL